MKVAVVGKGGVGKSAVAGSLCRHLARRGQRVLALDLDSMPGLAISLGLGEVDARLPAGLAERVQHKGWQVRSGTRPAHLVDKFAKKGPDGIGFLELGRLPHGIEPTVTVAFRYIIEKYRRRGRSMVADVAAGTRQPMYGWIDFAHTIVVVADPSSKSTLTARRLARAGVGTYVVANKVESQADVQAVQGAVGLPLLGWVPFDRAHSRKPNAKVVPRSMSHPTRRASVRWPS